jgi:hypothetical protein
MKKPIRVTDLTMILFGLVTGLIYYAGRLVVDEGLWAKVGIFDIPATRLIPFMCYFFLGAFAHQQGWFTQSGYRPKPKRWYAMCAAAFIIFMSCIKKESYPGGFGVALSYFLFCITAVFSLCAFFQRHINFTSRLLSSLSANSYAIYFVHYFVMLLIVMAVRPLQANVFVKWSLTGVISVAVCYLIARYALAHTIMFGRRVRA